MMDDFLYLIFHCRCIYRQTAYKEKNFVHFELLWKTTRWKHTFERRVLALTSLNIIWVKVMFLFLFILHIKLHLHYFHLSFLFAALKIKTLQQSYSGLFFSSGKVSCYKKKCHKLQSVIITFAVKRELPLFTLVTELVIWCDEWGN
jgi:hypothetical protein